MSIEVGKSNLLEPPDFNLSYKLDHFVERFRNIEIYSIRGETLDLFHDALTFSSMTNLDESI